MAREIHKSWELTDGTTVYGRLFQTTTSQLHTFVDLRMPYAQSFPSALYTFIQLDNGADSGGSAQRFYAGADETEAYWRMNFNEAEA